MQPSLSSPSLTLHAAGLSHGGDLFPGDGLHICRGWVQRVFRCNQPSNNVLILPTPPIISHKLTSREYMYGGFCGSTLTVWYATLLPQNRDNVGHNNVDLIWVTHYSGCSVVEGDLMLEDICVRLVPSY